MQMSGISAIGSGSGYPQVTAAQVSEASSFAKSLAAAVEREREEKAASLERAKTLYNEFLQYQADKAGEAAEAANAPEEKSAEQASGLNALFGENTQDALMMMIAMMAAGGSGSGLGGLGSDSSSSSLTGTSASQEMLIRVVPALMQLAETESANKQYAAQRDQAEQAAKETSV